MNEDTTFRLLRQVPIADLDLEYRKRWNEFYQNPEIFKTWLDERGWLEKEFYDAGSRYEKEMEESARQRKQHIFYPPVYNPNKTSIM
jgi:hypothetical protein